MMDPSEAFTILAEALAKTYEHSSSADWDESPWRWARDLEQGAMAGFTLDLAHAWLSSQGIPCSPMELKGSRSFIRLAGALVVEVEIAFRQRGDKLSWSCHSAPILLFGLTPDLAYAWFHTKRGGDLGAEFHFSSQSQAAEWGDGDLAQALKLIRISLEAR